MKGDKPYDYASMLKALRRIVSSIVGWDHYWIDDFVGAAALEAVRRKHNGAWLHHRDLRWAALAGIKATRPARFRREIPYAEVRPRGHNSSAEHIESLALASALWPRFDAEDRALLLASPNGLTLQQIARQQGTNVTTVCLRRRDARARLRGVA